MLRIGDYIFFPGGGSIVAITYILMSVAVALLSWLFYRFRVGGARLAKKQFHMDCPNTQILSSKMFSLGSYHYVEFYPRTGEPVVYQIARKEETAWRVADPRKSFNESY